MESEANSIGAALLCFFFSGILAIPLLHLNARLAPQLQLMDWPKARGVAREQIPILGYSLVLLALGTLMVLTHLEYFSPWILLTSTVIAVMGHLDDRRPLSALDKLFWQALSAACVVAFDPRIHEAIFVSYGLLGSCLAVFFVVGLMNAINFIDGIDGLAGLVMLVGALGILLFSGTTENFYGHFLYAAVIVGFLLPFLYFNVLRRRGFLGNVGSYFFGYLLAILHLSLPLGGEHVFSRLALSGLCFLVPLADATMVILSRSLTLRSPFHPDKGHLHHRLIQSAIPLRYVLLNFGLMGAAGLTMAGVLNWKNASGDLALWMLIALMVVATSLILMVEKASKWRMKAYLSLLEKGEPVFFLKYRLKQSNNLPLSFFALMRIEARISAEIRVVDLCFAEAPDSLIVVLRKLGEPIQRVASRFDTHFQKEGLEALLVEEGEFIKRSDAPTPKRASLR